MNRPVTRRTDLEACLRHLTPRVPRHEFEAVVDHALRSPGLRGASPETAIWLSLTAYVRHRLTDYDALLAEGYDVESARHFVLEPMNDVLRGWGSRRLVEDGEDPA